MIFLTFQKLHQENRDNKNAIHFDLWLSFHQQYLVFLFVIFFAQCGDEMSGQAQSD